MGSDLTWKNVEKTILSIFFSFVILAGMLLLIYGLNFSFAKANAKIIETKYENETKYEMTIEKIYDQDMEDDLYALSHRAGSIFNIILSFFFCVFCAEFAEEIGEVITCHMSNVNTQKYEE